MRDEGFCDWRDLIEIRRNPDGIVESSRRLIESVDIGQQLGDFEIPHCLLCGILLQLCGLFQGLNR